MTDELKINRPIQGEISRGYNKVVQQKGPQEFLDTIDKLLAVDGVTGIAWTQYTPYFNDGDSCEFSTHSIGVRLDSRFLPEGEEVDTDMYLNNTEDTYFSSYDLYTYPERGNWNNKIYELNGHSTEAIAEAIKEAEGAFAYFENVVRDNFGDHAEVYADANGFRVEEHKHE